MERPASNPDIARLPAVEYNKCLQDTFAFFKYKMVKLKDGRIGTVVGVDPRPVRGGPDGNFLCVSVARQAAPGRVLTAMEYVLPDDLEIVETPQKETELKS